MKKLIKKVDTENHQDVEGDSTYCSFSAWLIMICQIRKKDDTIVRELCMGWDCWIRDIKQESLLLNILDIFSSYFSCPCLPSPFWTHSRPSRPSPTLQGCSVVRFFKKRKEIEFEENATKAFSSYSSYCPLLDVDKFHVIGWPSALFSRWLASWGRQHCCLPIHE